MFDEYRLEGYNADFAYLVNEKDSEYFCKFCKQLRLDLTGKKNDRCRNCGSKEIIRGPVGFLNKDKLREKYA